MLVECVRTFLDAETGDMREEGERFEVTAERFSAINGTKYGQLVQEVVERPAEATTAPQKPIQKARRPRTRKNNKTQE